MNNQIETIKELLDSLPKKDIKLGNIFFNTRDFESLQDLVNSAIVKTKRNIHSKNPKAEYLEVDLDKLSQLKVEVDLYYAQIYSPEPYPYDDFNDFDDEIEEEEFY